MEERTDAERPKPKSSYEMAGAILGAILGSAAGAFTGQFFISLLIGVGAGWVLGLLAQARLNNAGQSQ